MHKTLSSFAALCVALLSCAPALAGEVSLLVLEADGSVHRVSSRGAARARGEELSPGVRGARFLVSDKAVAILGDGEAFYRLDLAKRGAEPRRFSKGWRDVRFVAMSHPFVYVYTQAKAKAGTLFRLKASGSSKRQKIATGLRDVGALTAYGGKVYLYLQAKGERGRIEELASDGSKRRVVSANWRKAEHIAVDGRWGYVFVNGQLYRYPLGAATQKKGPRRSSRISKGWAKVSAMVAAGGRVFLCLRERGKGALYWLNTSGWPRRKLSYGWRGLRGLAAY